VDLPVVPVILCGGSGTRLWPLSNADKPKQLLPLVGEHTMLQDTLLRLRGLDIDAAPPIIVCNERHGPLVAAQASALGDSLGAVVLEPTGRNSAPAVTVAALVARELVGSEKDALLLVLPADHLISAPAAFSDAV
jgi:mannose-1-phosphate guanylyltransferase / mannose-6-phosphate isomerase